MSEQETLSASWEAPSTYCNVTIRFLKTESFLPEVKTSVGVCLIENKLRTGSTEVGPESCGLGTANKLVVFCGDRVL